MNDLLERSTAIEAAGEACAYPHARSAKKGRIRVGIILAAISIYAILICLCAYFISDSLTIGKRMAADRFNATKDTAASESYQRFYDISYEKAEKAHHVSNRATITLGNLRRKQKLEVLHARDVYYDIKEPENKSWLNPNRDASLWLEVPAKGIFTVDLKPAEYIIDDESQYVLIRVPKPELSEFSIEYEHVETLHFEKPGIFKESAKYGADLAKERLENSELNIKQEMLNSQELYKRAETSAEAILENLVRQLNPNVPELEVEIEFFS